MLQPGTCLAAHLSEGLAPVIDGRLSNGAQNALRHIRRPRYLQKMPAVHVPSAERFWSINAFTVWGVNR